MQAVWKSRDPEAQSRYWRAETGRGKKWLHLGLQNGCHRSIKMLFRVSSDKLTRSLANVSVLHSGSAGPCWAEPETFGSVCISRGHCHGDFEDTLC